MARPLRSSSTGLGAPKPGLLGTAWLNLRASISRSVIFATKHWLWFLAVASVMGVLVLGQWSDQLTGHADDARLCAHNAVKFAETAGKHCAAQLRAVVAAAPTAHKSTCTPEGENKSVLCPLEEPGQPRLFVWADNLLVGLYTLLFVGSIITSFASLRPVRQPVPRSLLYVFAVSVGSCLVGAVIDLSENFWLLAHIGKRLDPKDTDVAEVAIASVWKFRLFALNLMLTLLWVARAAYRRRVPQAVLLAWPRWSWDRASRGWFDGSTVKIDPCNAALAYPLYPQHLIGLCGAPRDAALTCQREGDTLHLTVESAMLAEPYVVTITLEPGQPRIREVSLGCPNLAPRLRDQGLAERMLVTICCKAWRMGAVSLESSVPMSPDEKVRVQNRRWARMALRLGWDADLPDAALDMLPPGLHHVRTLQALMLYPDGRQWWLTFNYELKLRFVSDAVRAQADAKPLDLNRLARDRLCLTRLQAFAADFRIRLAP